MENFKFTFYMGLNDKDSKMQEINTIDAYKLTMNIVKKYCEGCTISEAVGLYTHEDGTVITENTLRIEVLFLNMETARKIVNELKTLFNQETIAVHHEPITSELW